MGRERIKLDALGEGGCRGGHRSLCRRSSPRPCRCSRYSAAQASQGPSGANPIVLLPQHVANNLFESDPRDTDRPTQQHATACPPSSDATMTGSNLPPVFLRLDVSHVALKAPPPCSSTRAADTETTSREERRGERMGRCA